jgi:hypothetical protein
MNTDKQNKVYRISIESLLSKHYRGDISNSSLISRDLKLYIIYLSRFQNTDYISFCNNNKYKNWLS